MRFARMAPIAGPLLLMLRAAGAHADPELLCGERPIPPAANHAVHRAPTPASGFGHWAAPPPVPTGVGVENATWLPLPALPGVDAKPIYDSRRDRLLLVGGTVPSGAATNGVWELPLGTAATWRPLAIAGTPPSPRLQGVAVYDSAADRVVCFGGRDGSSCLNDVWEVTLSDHPAWHPLAPAGELPEGRCGASAILDPVNDRIVIFGGARMNGTYFDDVRALSLESPRWTNLTPASSGPQARWNAAALYDPAHSRMLVYGGNGAGPAYFMGDLWSLSLSVDGAPWVSLSPAGTPPSPRAVPAFVPDPPGNRLLMYGGERQGLPVRGLWSLTLADVPVWDSLSVDGILPPDRTIPAATYDSRRDRMLLFGGGQDSARADLWALSLRPMLSWTRLMASDVQIEPRYATTPIFDAARRRVVTFGGVYTYQFYYDYYNEPYGDVASLSSDDVPQWGVVSPAGAGPSPRWNQAMALDSTRDRVIVFGGRGNGTTSSEVWTLDLGTGHWAQPTISGAGPTPRIGASAMIDEHRDRMILFGGRVLGSGADSATGETWALSLTEPMGWTLLEPTGSIPPRFYHSALYDAVSDRMVVYGGRSSSAGLGDTWALSFAGPGAWTPLSPAGNGPGVRYYHSVCLDSRRNRMLLFGGKNTPTGLEAFNDTWALTLDGAPTWSFVATPAGAPGPRYAAGAAYDPARDEMVVLWGTSGYCATGLLTDAWRLSLLDSTTPTSLALVGADAAPDRVHLTWYSHDAALSSWMLYRRDASTEWAALGEASASTDGLIDYTDRSVVPGARYAYRVGRRGLDSESFSSETWIDVPARFSLRLDPPRPNPGRGDLAVAFSLPGSAPASLEVLDVSGRRVLVRDVGAQGPGSHVTLLGALTPGIYLVRLRQGSRALNARAVVVR